jgi:hypothetical protein
MSSITSSRTHPDAVVGDGDGAGVLVVADPDLRLFVAFVEFRVSVRFQPQPVDRVGGVRDQLAQEDLFVAVERVGHEVEQLADLGLETEGLFVGLNGHRQPPELQNGRPARPGTGSA